VFEWLSSELAARTGFDALKSRGTLRIALQNAGLEPRTLTKEQASVVVMRVLPSELKLRGLSDGAAACMHIDAALRLMSFANTGPAAADAAFARFGRK
jgi:hypothetical protein